MKPVSVIFLIVAVVLVIVGLLTCSISMISSKRQNIDLYDTTIENGQSSGQFDFSEETVGKIQIDVGNCDVKVVFGADDNKVEINNFSSAGYVCEIDNRALVVEDTVNVLDITDIIENGKIRFKGFRYFLRDRKLTADNKSVTVYVSDKFDIKLVDISVNTGDVTIVGYHNNTDYNVKIGSGKLVASDIITESSFKSQVTKGSVSLKHITAKTVDVSIDEGSVFAVISGQEISAVAKKGSVRIESEADLAGYNYVLKAPASTVTLEELIKAGNYIANDAQLTGYIHATSGNGTVVVKTYIPEEDPDYDDNAGTGTAAETDGSEQDGQNAE